jgi:hypothetical protein
VGGWVGGWVGVLRVFVVGIVCDLLYV